MPPLVLTAGKYLTHLVGVSWSETAQGSLSSLPEALKLRLKKARIDVKILLPKSDEMSKFELFDRLNTGGSQATPQEVRNCLLLMQDTSFFEWIDKLVRYPSFEATIPLTEKQKQEQYNLELLVRFLVLQMTSEEEAKQIPDLQTYLNDKSLELAKGTGGFNRDAAEAVFKDTFDVLASLFGDGAFRRPRVGNPGEYLGPFLLAAFEIIALGTAINIEKVKANGNGWLRKV